MVLTCHTWSLLLQTIDWLFWLVCGSSGMQRCANLWAWSIIRRDSQEFQIFSSSWSATQPFLCSGQGAPPSPPAATCLSLRRAINYCKVEMVLRFKRNSYTLFFSLFYCPHLNQFSRYFFLLRFWSASSHMYSVGFRHEIQLITADL